MAIKSLKYIYKSLVAVFERSENVVFPNTTSSLDFLCV